VKIAQQSIWPVSVFGLGFLLLVIGLSGVANIQETRRINEQILAAEDNYRQVEKLIEAIQSDISRVAVLRRDRLLDEDGSTAEYPPQLAALRSKIEAYLAQLRVLRLQQGNGFERVETALRAYLNTAAAEFQEDPTPRTRSALVQNGFESQNITILAIAEELGKLNEANFSMRRQMRLSSSYKETSGKQY
jgi:hypothetical protein